MVLNTSTRIFIETLKTDDMELIIGLMFFSYLSVSHAVQGKNQETLQQKHDIRIITFYNMQTN